MRKINIILVICLLLMAMAVPATAAESQGNTYTVQDVTVKFEADSKFTIEEQQHIAELLVLGNDEVKPYGMTCFVLGHKYETEIITLVKHRVRATVPRCLEEIYEVRVCSRCSDTQQTLAGSHYISCCS